MPPAFVLSQDQTLHKNYFNNSRCQFLFKKNRFSSISLCDLNYIQIQCKLSGYIALFNFQTTFSFTADRLSTSLLHLANRSVIFNLAQVWRLSNFIFNFFKLFYFNLAALAFQQIAAWYLIYHRLKFCQTLIQTFLKVFFAAPPRNDLAFCGVRFNISQKFNLSNFYLNFF